MLKNKKSLAMIFISCVVFFCITSVMVLAKSKKEYNGDQYITSAEIKTSDNKVVVNGDKMYINSKYALEYKWSLPDNKYKKGDTLEFSIPKEFTIVEKKQIELNVDDKEVAIANILEDGDGFYIQMTFTTDYIEHYSNVSGMFDLAFVLNDKYIKTGSDNEIKLPDKEIIVTVPDPNDPSEGDGSGIGSGDLNKNKKTGREVTSKQYKKQNAFKWEIELGRDKLLGKASSFDEINHIYLEDTPKDQKMVPYGDMEPVWKGSYGFDGDVFKEVKWVYGGIPENEMGLNKNSEGDYDSFKLDILPRINKHIETAKSENKDKDITFEQYEFGYYTTPIKEVLEDTDFENKAVITIEYKDGTKDKWELSDSVKYNVAEGAITGQQAGAEFVKVDGDTNIPLAGATFDLYEKQATNDYKKVQSNITSDKDGKVRVGQLKVGDYYFIETKAPSGYELSSEKLSFNIDRSDLSENNQQLIYKNIGTYKNSQSKTSIGVTKKWSDANNQDGKRPTNVLVQLYANGKPKGEKVELNESNNWNYTWNNLDQTEDGQIIVYTVKEVSNVPGYTTNIDNSDTSNIVITNSYKPELTEVIGEKKWDDANNQDGKRPSKVTANLLADGTVIDSKEVNADNNWSYQFVNLPKYQNGRLVNYTVTENTVTDYSTTISGHNLINHYTPRQTSVSVTKKWDDNNNQDGKRPNSILVQLYADKESKGEPVELKEANDWSYTWNELPEKQNGQTITYSVKEVNVHPDYEQTINDKDHGNIIITNTHTPELTEIKGEKIWDDANNQDGKRPDSVKINLLADGQLYDSKEVSKAENWSYQFTNLPKYQNGKLVHYTVTEDSVSEYSTSISGNDIINHYTPGKTSATVTKEWNDENNQDGKRPESIMVQLYANDKKQGDPVTLDESNHWTYTWQDLDERSNGDLIIYTVKEVTVPNDYRQTINDENHGNIMITNSYTPELTEVKGEKQWDDHNNQDGKRPTSIKVNLLANGKVVDTKEVSEKDNWSYEFNLLPKYQDGELIHYTVTEDSVEDYSVTINGFDLVNTHTPGKTSVTVTKKWEDNQNQFNKRPKKILVQLFADDKKEGKPVELNQSNDWTHTWQDLDEKKDGKDIRYTVKEISEVPGYSVTVNDQNKGNIIITNTLNEEPKGNVPTPGGENEPPKQNENGHLPTTGETHTMWFVPMIGLGLIALTTSLTYKTKRK